MQERHPHYQTQALGPLAHVIGFGVCLTRHSLVLCGFGRVVQNLRPAFTVAGMMRPEIRLLLATISAEDPSSTGRAVSADVVAADLSRMRL